MRKTLITFLPLVAICLCSCKVSVEEAKERAKKILDTAFVDSTYVDQMGLEHPFKKLDAKYVKTKGVLNYSVIDTSKDIMRCDYDLEKKYVHFHQDLETRPVNVVRDIFVFERDGFVYNCRSSNYPVSKRVIKLDRHFEIDDLYLIEKDFDTASLPIHECISQREILEAIVSDEHNYFDKFENEESKITCKTKGKLGLCFEGNSIRRSDSGSLVINEVFEMKDAFCTKHNLEMIRTINGVSTTEKSEYTYSDDPVITEVDLSEYVELF